MYHIRSKKGQWSILKPMGFGSPEVLAGTGKSLCYWGKRVDGIPATFVPRKREHGHTAPSLPLPMPQMNDAQKKVLGQERELEATLKEQKGKLEQMLIAQKDARKRLEEAQAKLGDLEV